MPKRIVLLLLVTAALSISGCADNSKGRFKVGAPYTIKGVTYYPQENYTQVQTGVASWYGPGFDGKKTANGERFDEDALTAAHPTLQMPSLVRVTNLQNGRSVVVRVNDRGPFHSNRVMDVSKEAANVLGFRMYGTAHVRLEVLGPESMALAKAAKQGVDTRGAEIAFNNSGTLDERFAAFYPTMVAVPPPGVMVASNAYQPGISGNQVIMTETLAVPPSPVPPMVQETIVTTSRTSAPLPQRSPVRQAVPPAITKTTRVYQMAPVLEGEPTTSVPARIEVVRTEANYMPEKPQFMGVVP